MWMESGCGDGMNLKKIQAFLLVIDKGSFSDAAELMGLSQPAISQHVKSLEEDLGVSLINRSSSFVQPTVAGRYVYKIGSQMLTLCKELEEGVHAYHGTLTGTLRIGASTIPGTYLVPKWIGQFHEKYPKVDVVLEIGDSQGMLNKLSNRQVDLVLIGSKPSCPDMEFEIVAEDTLVLIAPNNHPIFSAKWDGEVKRLLQFPFVIREMGSGTRRAMEEWLRRYEVNLSDMKTVAQMGSTESLIAAVEAGIGLSLVSQLAAAPAVKANRIQTVAEVSEIQRMFHLAYLKARQDHPIIKEFVHFIQSSDIE
jgi:DNA-binding transcriptional LysR family regulator